MMRSTGGCAFLYDTTASVHFAPKLSDSSIWTSSSQTLFIILAIASKSIVLSLSDARPRRDLGCSTLATTRDRFSSARSRAPCIEIMRHAKHRADALRFLAPTVTMQ